jgi:serine/threonine-protein kinase
MLAMQGKHAEAAAALLEALTTPLEEYGRLGDDERRLVTMAATYLQKAGDFTGAARLFEALGDAERSSLLDLTPYVAPTTAAADEPAAHEESSELREVLTKTMPSANSDDIPESTVQPRPSEPLPAGESVRDAVADARALMSDGNADGAGELLAEAGYCYEAGICFLKAGNPEAALAQLSLVAPGTAHYPAAARTAIRIAGRVGFCDGELYRFLTPFLSGGPTDRKELELFRRISELLEECGLIGAAACVLEVAYARFPDDRLVADRLVQLRMGVRPPDSLLGDEESAAVSVQLLEPVQAPATRRGGFQTTAGRPGSGAWAGETGLGGAARFAGSTGAASIANQAASLAAEPHPPLPHGLSQPGEQERVRISAIPGPGATVEEWNPGMVVGGRFRLDALIGRGGMAEVYSATDLELEEEVALKVFSGQLVTEDYLQEAVHRFRQELKLCRKLSHRNIIQVYDIGIHAGHRYFTMELLHGQSLGDMLGVPLDLDVGLRILIQACAGLHAAHERGVVHRDVKPDNIFVTSNGVVKIMDFGIAKSSVKSGQTTFGTIAGTPEYMSPEQINDFSAAGPAADQYSLGVVAYEMFAGQIPFVHEHMVLLLTMHLESQPTPPREINPAISEQLENIILKMLAKNPAERFESCQSVQSALLKLRPMLG